MTYIPQRRQNPFIASVTVMLLGLPAIGCGSDGTVLEVGTDTDSSTGDGADADTDTDMVLGYTFDGSDCVVVSGCDCSPYCNQVFASYIGCEIACMGADCDQVCGAQLFDCCDDRCVNFDNDILNCGECSNVCEGDHPFCENGTCRAEPPCTADSCGSGFCCGSSCCREGQLCCAVPGPLATPATCVDPTSTGTCPMGCKACVCASPDTPIATPDGDVPIALLDVGDLVLSVDHGKVAAVPILQVNQVPVSNHEVERVVLSNGNVLEISARHPTADNRIFSDLLPGDTFGGIEIQSITTVPYRSPNTYDILPDSDTGVYFAGGIPIGSTLHPTYFEPVQSFYNKINVESVSNQGDTNQGDTNQGDTCVAPTDGNEYKIPI